MVARFSAELDALAAPGARIGVAVSGGPDSLALLLVAAAARPGLVEAVTVDHGLRSESRAEAEMVAGICESLGVAHSTLKLDGLDAGAGNLQAEARERRYAAIAQWASGRGLGAVATAHHLDDQAETVLMRLARGSGVGGLSGVQPSRALAPGVLLVRPLLGWRRDELRAIVDDAGIVPASDPSNSDLRFDRTRARELLASADWLDPARLAAAASNFGDADRALDWAASEAFRERSSRDGETLLVDPSGLPREIKRRLLIAAIAEMGCAEPSGPQLVDALLRLDAGETTTLAGLKLEGGDPWRVSPAPPRRSRSFTLR